MPSAITLIQPSLGSVDWGTNMNTNLQTIQDTLNTILNGLTYIYRGEQSGNDYEIGSFTCNGAWHDFDLSSKLPASCDSAHLKLEIYGAATSIKFRVQPYGYTTYNAVHYVRTQAVNVYNAIECIIKTPSSQIQYNIDAAAVQATLNVKGWFIPLTAL